MHFITEQRTRPASWRPSAPLPAGCYLTLSHSPADFRPAPRNGQPTLMTRPPVRCPCAGRRVLRGWDHVLAIERSRA
jgi:hypothetical protein